MRMSMYMALQPTMGQELSMKLKPRLELRHSAQMLQMRAAILGALHPEGDFHPKGACPDCGHQMSHEEILRGFADDPYDTTTQCPTCSNRFQPRLVSQHAAGTMELPFYCELQTLTQMEDLEGMSFEKIRAEYPAVLASARYYWGSLTKGFERLDVKFEGEPELSWKDRVLAFLGKCPDSVIAEVCGVGKSAVWRLRTKHKIAAYKGTP